MWKNKVQRRGLLDLGLGVFIHVSTTRVTAPQLTEMLLSRREEMFHIVARGGRQSPTIRSLPATGTRWSDSITLASSMCCWA